MEVNNWILKKFISEIKFNTFSIDEILYKNKIPLSKDSTTIDWNSIKLKYSFYYDFVNNENEIKNRLLNSSLINYKNLIIDIGYEYKSFEIDSKLFINNWEDFVSSNGFCGIIVISPDFKYFLEFTDDCDYLLFSNFLI
jgi:hypothetical protein